MIRDCEGGLSTDGIFDYMYYILIVSILNRIGFRFKIHDDKTTIMILRFIIWSIYFGMMDRHN